MTDFATLTRPSSPNTYLIGPAPEAGVAIAAPVDDQAPVFDVPATVLATAWRGVVEAEARAVVNGVSADGLQVEAEDRSPVFGFVDTVSFRALAIGETQSTFAAYSRSQVGYWDFGANKRRLRRWSRALAERVAGGA